MLPEPLRLKLEFAIGELEMEMSRLEPLFQYARQRPLDHIETIAAAGALHGLYSGIESIFLLIQKGLDGRVPHEHSAWHRELLRLMAQETSHRPAVLTRETADLLKDYLNFRHFFRHHYATSVDADLVRIKLNSFPPVWSRVHQELQIFLNGA